MTASTRRAGVVGLGLIGTSIGLALRDAGWQVIGLDASPERAQRAYELGAIDTVTPTLDEVAGPFVDLAVVAVPPAATQATVNALFAAGANTVTDTCSIKGPIVAGLVRHGGFLGGHPMAGSDRSGPDAARRGLFGGARWALTPGPRTRIDVLAVATEAVRAMGAQPVVMSAERHDYAVARTSHLPHVVAGALARLASGAGEIGQLAGSGFRDTTRVANGPPELWVEILQSNRDEVLVALDGFEAQLDLVRTALEHGDGMALAAWLAGGVTARRAVLGRMDVAADPGQQTPSLVHA